jgi:hypothetical protein
VGFSILIYDYLKGLVVGACANHEAARMVRALRQKGAMFTS